MHQCVHRLGRAGVLCALIVVFVIVGLQNTVAAFLNGSETESVHLVVPENIVVIEPAEQPQANLISTNRAKLGDSGIHLWSPSSFYCLPICSNHPFGKVLKNDGKHGLGRIGRYSAVEATLFDYSGVFP